MTTRRLLAIGFIFVCTAAAWSILGTTVVDRTGELDDRLSQEVAKLWGGRHVQVAPLVSVRRPREVTEELKEQDAKGATVVRTVKRTVIQEAPFPAASSRVRVDLGLDHRRKGLLWYDTYTVAFEADYRFVSPDSVEREVVVRFGFPSKEATYDAFVVSLDGHEAPPTTDYSEGVTLTRRLPPGGDMVLRVAYRSRGLGEWSYAFVKEGVAQVRDFALTLTTDFGGFDFPACIFLVVSYLRDIGVARSHVGAAPELPQGNLCTPGGGVQHRSLKGTAGCRLQRSCVSHAGGELAGVVNRLSDERRREA